MLRRGACLPPAPSRSMALNSGLGTMRVVVFPGCPGKLQLGREEAEWSLVRVGLDGAAGTRLPGSRGANPPLSEEEPALGGPDKRV